MDSEPFNTHMFQLCFFADLAALRQVKNFFNYLGSSNWPVELETIRQNILQKSIMDREISPNIGNLYIIIEELRKALERIDPVSLDSIDAALREDTDENACDYAEIGNNVEQQETLTHASSVHDRNELEVSITDERMTAVDRRN